MTQTTTTLPRKERERLVRREAMLDAARAVFAEKGYGEATLEEIASRAEFGKGTLYNYFEGGKEGILFSILDDVFDELVLLTRRIFLAEDRFTSFRTRLQRYISSVLEFFLANRDLFAILMKEAHRIAFEDGSEKQAYFHRQEERFVEIMLPAIDAAIAAGELKDMPAPAMLHMIRGNVNGYLMFVLCNPACRNAEQTMAPEQAADFLTTVLIDGMGNPAGHNGSTAATRTKSPNK